MENSMLNEIDGIVTRYEQGHMSRRQLIAGLAALAMMPSNVSATRSSTPVFQAKSLNHVSLAVSDVTRSADFYSHVLGAELVSKQGGGMNLGLGDSFLGLYNIPGEPRIHHFCVGLDSYDVEDCARRLREAGIEPYLRPDKPEVYFRDPDGVMVQLEDKEYRG